MSAADLPFARMVDTTEYPNGVTYAPPAAEVAERLAARRLAAKLPEVRTWYAAHGPMGEGAGLDWHESMGKWAAVCRCGASWLGADRLAVADAQLGHERDENAREALEALHRRPA